MNANRYNLGSEGVGWRGEEGYGRGQKKKGIKETNQQKEKLIQRNKNQLLKIIIKNKLKKGRILPQQEKANRLSRDSLHNEREFLK